MAIRFFSGSLLFNSSITAKTIAPSLLSRSFSASSAARRFSLIRAISTAAAANRFPNLRPSFTTRSFATRATSSSLNDPSPNWSNRPPKETILLDGCDFEHWLVVMEAPEGNPTRDEIIDSYIKTLAMVVGSEEKARMSIYSVSTRCYYAFGALVSEELSYKIKELPRVRWVLPDSYLDVKNKDYGGEPFINGQAVPYDPKYHEEWIRNNARANERNRRNSDRPKNFDRSRNYERRRENMQRNMQPNPTAYQGMQNSQPAMSGPMDPNNITGVPPPPPRSNYTGGPNNFRGGPPPPPNSYADGPPQQSPNNYMGGQPQNNIGGMQPSNMGGMPQNNMGGVPQNNMGGMPQNMGGMPQNNMGRMPQNNMGGMPQNNMGGMPSTGWSNNMQENMQQNFPNVPNNEGMPYQRAPQNYQNSYNPNRDGSTSGGNN